MRFIVTAASRADASRALSDYGYEIYIPKMLHEYLVGVQNHARTNFAGDGPLARECSPAFYEAAWELCRRGILRPGITRVGQQATTDGSSGNGYSVTAYGREWMLRVLDYPFVTSRPDRFMKLIEPLGSLLGRSFVRRAEEASRYHYATAYLASCAMSGAAAESILLRAAITKTQSDIAVLKAYRSSGGRTKVENMLVGQSSQALANRFKDLMDLLKYWRNAAAHGDDTDISEFEAFEALSRLLRLAHFTRDNWDELTSPSS